MTDPVALKKAIENLAQKQHVISDDARFAKANQYRVDYPNPAHMNVLIKELNRSVRFLMGMFQSTHIDQAFLQLARPFQLFVMQFLVGLVRGLGVVLGVIVALIFLLHACKEYLPVTFFIELHSYLNALKS